MCFTLKKNKYLPTIPPQNTKLETGESISQGKTETVHEEPKIVQCKMRDHVRVLIILHYSYRRYVAQPIETRVR